MQPHGLVFQITPEQMWQNLDGSADLTACPCMTWINHWCHHTGEWSVLRCSVLECQDEGTEGAHVTLQGVQGTPIVVPMCPAHNHPTNRSLMRFKPGTRGVLAVKTDWCSPES